MQDGTASNTTFTSVDTLNGELGTDKFELTVLAGTNPATTLADVSNIEQVYIQQRDGSNKYTYDATNTTGVNQFWLTDSVDGKVDVTNVGELATIGADNALGTYTVNFDAASVLSGSSDTVSVVATNGSDIVVDVNNSDDAVEAVSLSSAGTVANTVAVDAGAAVKTFTVTGAADLTLDSSSGDIVDGGSIDASTRDGSLTYVLDDKVDTLTTGAGDEQITIDGNQFESSDPARSLDLGEGDNTLVISANPLTSLDASGSGTHSITNVAVVEQQADGAVDASLLAGGQEVKITESGDAFGSGSSTTITLGAEDIITVADGIDTSNGLGVKLADASGENDDATVTLEDMDQGKITTQNDDDVNAIEELTLVSAGTGSGGNTVDTLDASITTTVDLDGTADLALPIVEVNDPSGDATGVIDASGLGGDLTLGSASDDFKGGASGDSVSITLGSGSNEVYFGAEALSTDSVVGTTGTDDTVFLTEASGSTNEMTLTSVETVEITTVADDNIFSLKNWTDVGTIKAVGSTSGSEDLTLSEVGAGQSVEVAATVDGSGDYSGIESLTLNGAEGVESVAVDLKSTDGAGYANSAGGADGVLELATDTGALSITDSLVDASGDYADQYVTVVGDSDTDLTTLTLAGGGTDASGDNATLEVVGSGANVDLETVDASELAGNVDISGITTAEGANVTLGAGDNTLTIAEGDAKLDQLVVDGGEGADTLAFTTADVASGSTTTYRIESSNVETFDLDVSGDGSSGGTAELDLRDTDGVTEVAAEFLNSADDAFSISNASDLRTLTLSGQTAGVTVSGVNAALAVATAGAVNGTTANGFTADDATSLTLTQGSSGDNTTFAALSADAATTVTLGGSDDSISGADIAVTTFGADEATSLTLDTDNGEILVDDITADKLATVTISGSDAATLGEDASGNASDSLDTAALATVAGGEATGDITLSSAMEYAADASITTGDGGDTVTLTSSVASGVTVNTGSGDDTVTLDTGAMRAADAGAGSDTLVLGGPQGSGTGLIDLSQAGDQVVEVNGFTDDTVQTNFENVDVSNVTSANSHGWKITAAEGGSTITGSDYNDEIIGGAGGDTITGGAGADTIKLGDGGDTVKYGLGDGSAVGAASGDFSGFDTVTGFTSASGGDVIDATGTSDSGGVVIVASDGADSGGANLDFSADAQLDVDSVVGFLNDSSGGAGLTAGETDFVAIYDGASGGDSTFLYYVVDDTSGGTIAADEVQLVGSVDALLDGSGDFAA